MLALLEGLLLEGLLRGHSLGAHRQILELQDLPDLDLDVLARAVEIQQVRRRDGSSG